jgi:hypothetical protein
VSRSHCRIVYFATHGLVAGDIKGVAEPSLALSLPKVPSVLDDGLLASAKARHGNVATQHVCCENSRLIVAIKWPRGGRIAVSR